MPLMIGLLTVNKLITVICDPREQIHNVVCDNKYRFCCHELWPCNKNSVFTDSTVANFIGDYVSRTYDDTVTILCQ